MTYHYTNSEPNADMNNDRIDIMKELIRITERSLQGWDERVRNICPESAKKPEYALAIWYILCRIYLNIGNKTSIMEFSGSFSGLYEESTVRKRLKDLRQEGVIRYVENRFQISDEAIKAIEEQLMSYLNRYWSIAEKAKSIGMIEEKSLKEAAYSTPQDQHGHVPPPRPLKGIIS
jgi:hypothetical protein